jgi:hypothetical protein
VEWNQSFLYLVIGKKEWSVSKIWSKKVYTIQQKKIHSSYLYRRHISDGRITKIQTKFSVTPMGCVCCRYRKTIQQWTLVLFISTVFYFCMLCNIRSQIIPSFSFCFTGFWSDYTECISTNNRDSGRRRTYRSSSEDNDFSQTTIHPRYGTLFISLCFKRICFSRYTHKSNSQLFVSFWICPMNETFCLKIVEWCIIGYLRVHFFSLSSFIFFSSPSLPIIISLLFFLFLSKKKRERNNAV